MSKTFGICYRSNDLFDHFVPRIQKILEDAGHKAVVKVVERGVDPSRSELREWKGVLKDDVGRNFFTDKTCSSPFYGRSVELDSLIGQLLVEKFNSGEASHEYGSLPWWKSAFVRAARVMASHYGEPAQVIVDQHHVYDHWDSAKTRTMFEDAMKIWIRELFPNCQVVYGTGRPSWEPPKPPEDGFLIADRHHLEHPGVRILRLPAETAIWDLGEAGLLPWEGVTNDELRHALRYWLK